MENYQDRPVQEQVTRGFSQPWPGQRDGGRDNANRIIRSEQIYSEGRCQHCYMLVRRAAWTSAYASLSVCLVGPQSSPLGGWMTSSCFIFPDVACWILVSQNIPTSILKVNTVSLENVRSSKNNRKTIPLRKISKLKKNTKITNEFKYVIKFFCYYI